MIEPWQIFASLGIALALAEIFTPSFFALPAGLAFLATAGVALFTHDWTLLSVALAVNLSIVYATFQRFIWPKLQRKSTPTNAEGMSGKLAVVTEAIDPKTGSGEVKLYGDRWRVIAQQPFAVGDHVRIVRTEGNRVIIEAPQA
ncbi:MAG TPA: NfeD family protein [Polyangiaceae bacterium]|nr:NfeD family protein [Polyangiaceae bacterium]